MTTRDLLASMVGILTREGGHRWPEEIDQIMMAMAVLAEPETSSQPHQHVVHIFCDRCHTSLALSSSMSADLNPHLYATARALGWLLSARTCASLGAEETSWSQDFCDRCVAALSTER